ncbi:serine/threonine dehydratase [Streptomyces radicis]|uniref:Pyridoxal-phosphate dependent enzyme n=1 Tax=Streptomyces radicis TaxID=1750517 RepID=A0A3A9WIP0_9ACTN|nr:serine/threonine dehydratase [Streptomyces radicis]RKN09324.1 pyridoxal-phosphate dependent enzyme [Streptomyces radicis]RKN23078.1 pyridoxal-phosphate dependent enzyme [Streptomyces radicis]
MIGSGDVRKAVERVGDRVRTVALAPAGERVWFALEFLQHTGSFKARGALNFTTAAAESGAMPRAGIAIASGGNAGLACAWAAGERGIPATVFVPETAPRVKVARLRALGAEVRQVGREYAEAAEACAAFVAGSGALASHAYDHPLIAAGAGTLLDEIVAARPSITTVVVAAGGGGLFAGVAAAAEERGVRVVAVEPEHCRALNAGLAAGGPVDVPVDSVAADSLGARRASADAVAWAARPHTRSVLVPDKAITAARRELWQDHRIAVEVGAAAAQAALTSGAYAPAPDEEVCVVLCGANTDPSDLAR